MMSSESNRRKSLNRKKDREPSTPKNVGTDEQQAEVYDLLNNSDVVEQLKGTKPLTRRLMDFYFNYLTSMRFKDSDNVCMVPPSVTEKLYKLEHHKIEEALTGFQVLERQFAIFAIHEISISRANFIRTLLLVYSRPEETVFVFSTDEINSGKVADCKINEFIEKLGSAINCDLFSVRPIKQISKLSAEYNVDRLLALMEPIAKHVNSYDTVDGVQIPSDNIVKSFRMDLLRKLHGFHLSC